MREQGTQLRGSAADPGQSGQMDGLWTTAPGQSERMDRLQTQGSKDCGPRAVGTDGWTLLKRLSILPIGVEIPGIIVNACELKFKEVT